MAFVQATGTHFTLNNNIFVPIGASVYGHYGSNANFLERINAAVAMKLNILRYINFLQPYDATAGAEYNESVWSKIDYGLNQARQAGIKILLDLSDISGFAEARGYATFDSNYTTLYQSVVAWLAERTNTFNSLKYKNDDTIAIFAISGEVGDMPLGVAYTFFNTIGGAMKNAGFQQIIQAGGMKPEQIVSASYGYVNYNPIDILSSSNIDCASTHPYYTFSDMNTLFPVLNTYSIAKNKPWFIEEFGFRDKDNQKREDFRRVYKLGFQNKAAGILFWNLDENEYASGYSNFGVSTAGITPETYQLIKSMGKTGAFSIRDIVF